MGPDGHGGGSGGYVNSCYLLDAADRKGPL
jgi:hypothetical protein